MRRSVFTHPVHIQFVVLVGLDHGIGNSCNNVGYMFGVELFQRFFVLLQRQAHFFLSVKLLFGCRQLSQLAQFSCR